MLPEPKSKHHLSRYLRFVEHAKANQPTSGYMEKHHIHPRSMGGSDSKDNLILLSARQHFICHWLLWNAYRNKQMSHAFWFMQNKTKYKRANSKTYSLLKEAQSTRMREQNPQLREDVRRKNSEARFLNNTMKTDKSKQALSEALKKKYETEDHPCQGKEWKQQTIHCPHCGKEGGVSNLKRYHFDNCKVRRSLQES